MARSAVWLCFSVTAALSWACAADATCGKVQSCYHNKKSAARVLQAATIDACCNSCSSDQSCVGVLYADGWCHMWDKLFHLEPGCVNGNCRSCALKTDFVTPAPLPTPPTPAPPSPTPAPAPPAPAPVPASGSWSKNMGKNCYDGHGATNIDATPVGKLTLANCQKSCDESAGCSGITITWSLHGEATDCWRRSNINIDACDSGDGYDTWIKTSPVPPPAPHGSCGQVQKCYPNGKKPWRHFNVDTMEQCCSACKSDAACVGVITQGKTCHIWHNIYHLETGCTGKTCRPCVLKDSPYSPPTPPPPPPPTPAPTPLPPSPFPGSAICGKVQACYHNKKEASYKFKAFSIDQCCSYCQGSEDCYGIIYKDSTCQIRNSALHVVTGCIGNNCLPCQHKSDMPPPKPTPPPPSPPSPPTPPPTPNPPSPAHPDPWPMATPESVGLKKEDLDSAKAFINANVLMRQCFLLIKNGKIVYEWYDPTAPDPPLTPPWQGPAQDKPHHGYSMTKTAGGFLLLLAATEDGLDIDADITEKYGIQSPRPYRVTVRQMMAQIIGGEDRPGELWRYDEMGNMWLHLFPKIIQAATGHDAAYYLGRLHDLIGLSSSFTWPDVNTKWFRGASGSCRDWARFGQLILNGGIWNGKQVIAKRYIDDMQQPLKEAPYNSYSNPCYGLLVWLNADKSKTPGCCWEASRLPDPKCNQETFIDGAVHDMTLNIGLYGQVVMTLPSVDTVVVGFGRDLRPIEPARIGYYPGVCKALGIPCNTPPPLPETKCGELLECTGVSAQCFSGGSWSHAEPMPGKEQCVDCFRNRLPMYEHEFPEAHYMVDKCPIKTHHDAFKYIECFCGLAGNNANPFHPWPSTTTTTPPPSPAPPLPPLPPVPTPAPRPQQPPCQLSAKCIEGLKKPRQCMSTVYGGGHKCFQGIKIWQKELSEQYGCPVFDNSSQPILASKAFCWCGVDHPTVSRNLTTYLPPPEDHLQVDVSSEGGVCHNIHDGKILKHHGKGGVKMDLRDCSFETDGSAEKVAVCFQQKEHVSLKCARCFGKSSKCSEDHCLVQCACYDSPECTTCMKSNCKGPFGGCSGIKMESASSSLADDEVDLSDFDLWEEEEQVAYTLVV